MRSLHSFAVLAMLLAPQAALADGPDSPRPDPWNKATHPPAEITPPQAPTWTKPPQGAANVSTSGVDVQPVTPPAPVNDANLELRVKQLEEELVAVRAAQATPSGDDWTKRIKLGGYIQPQLIWQTFNAAASPNADANGQLPSGIDANGTIAKSDGTTTNPDFFRLRRARLFAQLSIDAATMMLEIEPLPRGGSIPASGTIARRVYAAGIARLSKSVRLEIGAGEFKVPFGWEVLQLDPDRPFIERSYAEGAMFPSEHDLGAFAHLYADKFTLMTAVLNGVMLGEKNFAIVPDLNRSKDFVGRANYDFGPADIGASGYVGSGSLVDGANLRFKQFSRWAANVELALHHVFSPRLGQTKAFAELTYGQNMDRGTLISYALPTIPTDITQDVVNKHEVGGFVRVEQDATKWLTMGVRYDYYTPDTSIGDNQRHTFSGVAAVHFVKQLQLMLEYDSALDRIHPTSAATWRTKTINTLSLVLQGRLL